jgi:hypothetical protein
MSNTRVYENVFAALNYNVEDSFQVNWGSGKGGGIANGFSAAGAA